VYVADSFALRDAAAWRVYFAETTAFIAAAPESADIIALEVPIRGSSLPTGLLARAIHTALAGITLSSTGDATAMYRDIESWSWEFRVCGCDFFAFVLSPAYPRDHARYIAWRQPLILLQPEHSFTSHGISSQNTDRATLSRRSELAFQSAGRHYLAEITRRLPKALRLIKPLTAGDPPIAWWKTALLISIDDAN
jgi:hypothetical protein